ncbi:MAG: substrate-binding domain-containing protein [Hyphomicrobiaceae bacterium]
MSLRSLLGAIALSALAAPVMAQTEITRLTIHGSNTIGAKLMPRIVEDFAVSLGYRVVRVAGDKPEEVEIRLAREDGTVGGIVRVHSHGSGTAVPGLVSRAAQIGMSSRPVSEKELAMAAKASMPDLRQPGYEHVLALDGLVVVVSPENPVRALTLDQIAAIFAGQVRDWSEVGGKPAPINLYARDAKSGTYDTFDALVLRAHKVALAAGARRFESSEDLSDSVARDPAGIGFIGFAYVRNAKPLSIASVCGVTSDPRTYEVKTEEYPLSRRLYLYTAAPPSDDMTGLLLQYALSAKSDPVVQDEGFIDLRPTLPREPGQLGRLVTALQMQGTDFDAESFKRLTLDLQRTQRISTTFRFLPNAITLDNRALVDIGRLAEMVKPLMVANPNLTLTAVGFTDSTGSADGNVTLSQTRAESVRTALLARLGKAYAPRLLARGYGPLLPVACNEAIDGRDKNRRVEIWLR